MLLYKSSCSSFLETFSINFELKGDVGNELR